MGFHVTSFLSPASPQFLLKLYLRSQVILNNSQFDMAVYWSEPALQKTSVKVLCCGTLRIVL